MLLYIPFICIALGALINWKGLPEKVLDLINLIMNASLMLLMTVVGMNVGTSREVMDNIGTIGLNCAIMCLESMFIPVTRAVGPELGITALISGTIITIFVPIWLPISGVIFG